MPKLQHHRRFVEAESPDITIYPNQHRLVGWIVLSGVPSLCGLLIAIGMFILLTIC